MLIGILMIVVLGARGCFCSAAGFEFFAQELSVAQTQDFLIHTDTVRAVQHRGFVELRLLCNQCFAVNDDLTLAAEIGRQRVLDDAFHRGGFSRRLCRPAQDEAGTAGGVRCRSSVVA